MHLVIYQEQMAILHWILTIMFKATIAETEHCLHTENNDEPCKVTKDRSLLRGRCTEKKAMS